MQFGFLGSKFSSNYSHISLIKLGQLLLELSLELLARKVGILVEDTEHILDPENKRW